MFYTAISGLNAFRSQLSVISDNIANSQTASYKAGDVSFAEVIASSSSNSTGNVGSGVNIQNIALGWTQGAISNTGNVNDFAVTGAGFFIVQDTAGTGYTRDGKFSFNADSELVNADGMNVQGYAINPTTGVVATEYSPIVISTAQSPASATTSMTTTVNLDASALIGGTSAFSTTTNVYDSLGNAIPLTIKFQKAVANQWTWDASIPVTIPPTGTAAGSGTLNFTAAGQLDSGAGGAVWTDPSIVLTLANGAASTQTVTWDLYNDTPAPGVTNGTLTQFAGTSTIYSMSQDGRTSGLLTGISSNNNGIITASYSNGQTNSLYQIALADCQNYDGLSKIGNNLYRDTPTITGGMIAGSPGSGKFGTVASGSLEASNVDMAKEMANMILAQRAYESCARVFTIESEMLKTVVNMS
jgi:flagellar hook protein FlgE